MKYNSWSLPWQVTIQFISFLTIKFCFHLLSADITIITVLTYDDEVAKKGNTDEERKRLREAAIEVTGSDRRNVFLIANSFSGPQDYSPIYKERVLQVVLKSLKCGELSVKMRQNERETHKAQAQ